MSNRREHEVPDQEYNRGEELSSARITSQLVFMSAQLEKALEVFIEIERKIDGILIPIDDDSGMNTPGLPPRKKGSDISNTIDDLNGMISTLQRRMSLIIERVQL